MTPEDQRAATEWNGQDRRAPANCEAGIKALKYLDGDGPDHPGVHEELRGLKSLVSEVRTLARWVVLFAGVIAACTVWSVWRQ